MSVVLLVTIGGETHPLTITKRPLILGRSKRCNVRFADNMMSSKHCEIALGENLRIVVKDLNSSNGTFINDTKVEAGHVYIGDTLKVGSITMVVDETKLTRSEEEALTSETISKKQKFVNLEKKKKSGKTQLVQDFTQIQMGIPGESTQDGNQRTYIIDQGAIASVVKQPNKKTPSKKKSKIINKDKTGFFKKIFKSFRK